MRVVTHAFLPHPDQGTSGVSHNGHRLMRQPGSRPQHQDAESRDRNVDHPTLVRRGECASVTTERAVLKVEKADSVSDTRELARRRRRKATVHQILAFASVSSPHP